MEPNRAQDADDQFWRRLILPEEDRRRLGVVWTGSYRWFRSANVVDLWHCRNPAERARICEVLLRGPR
jgi:hypothetical protein